MQDHVAQPDALLAETKFRPPRPHRDVIQRQLLAQALGTALLEYRVTLLSAPAGYGKTTLLAAIPQIYPRLPLAWLTLDAEDDDPTRFLLGLLAAFKHVVPTCGEALSYMSPEPSGPDTSAPSVAETHTQTIQFVTALINDLDQNLPEPFVLVLDDLHFVSDPDIYAALDYMIERMPPQMHLAIATRYDPPLHLARLTARRQLFDLRISELRFTPEEAALFLNRTLDLGLSAQEVEALDTQTEGWAAGLVLLTSALTRIPSGRDRTLFIRETLQNRRITFEFLADEVLSHQDPLVRRFLLETSILTELTPALCEAVTGQPNGRAILGELYRRNLFLTAIDEAQIEGDRPAYRYHALFAEFLRAQLQQESPLKMSELHIRAARAESLPGRVIGHYLAAQEWEQAARGIEQFGDQMILQGLLGTLLSWIQALPAVVYQNHPRLIYMHGICALQRGNVEGVHQILSQALGEYRRQGDLEKQAAIYCALASLALTQADFAECERLAGEAQTYPLQPPTEVLLAMVRASLALFLKSDWSAAQENLRAALRRVRDSGSTEALLYFTLYLGQEFTALPGLLELLEDFCEETHARYAHQLSPIRLGIEDVLAFICLRRGQLDRAIEQSQSALAIKGQLGGYLFLGLSAAWVAAMTYTARRDYENAHRYLRIMRQQVGQMALNEIVQNNGLFPYGKLCWFEGRFDETRRVYEQMCVLAEQSELSYAQVLRTLLRGMLEISDRQYAQAEQTLSHAIKLEQRELISANFANARLFLAYLYFLWRRPRAALEILSEVLEQCERDATPGVILQEGPIVIPLLELAIGRGTHVEYARQLLVLLGGPDRTRHVPRTPSQGGMTAREIEVVRLIAAGASNRDIAEQLVISLPTVKSHVAHIMDKLDASSRTQIVAKARELKVI